MKMGYGIWIAILGILVIIAGGVMYAVYHHTGRDLGAAGVIVGLILVIVGAWWYMTKDKSAPKAAVIPQPTQPATTP
jgi:membrane protein DedA with SNARE-associated domain